MSTMELPPPARRLDRCLMDALDAAAAGDEPQLDAALTALDALPATFTRRLLSTAVRPVVEQRLPDGIDSDDVSALLAEVENASAAAGLALDPLAMIVVVTGTFGVILEDENGAGPQVSVPDVTRHAVVLLAHLVPSRPARRRLLDAAWQEFARADNQDD